MGYDIRAHIVLLAILIIFEHRYGVITCLSHFFIASLLLVLMAALSGVLSVNGGILAIDVSVVDLQRNVGTLFSIDVHVLITQREFTSDCVCELTIKL